MTDFYVYIHKKLSNTKVFYVGKGHARRAWERSRRNRHWLSIVAKHGYTVEIVQSGMQEWWAHEMEIELIAFYGRENLCNMTNGGEGISGNIRSLETREKISRSHKGKRLGINLTDSHKKAISKSGIGRKMPLDAVEKIRLSNIGRRHSDDSKKRMSFSHKGKKLSNSHKLSLSIAGKGRKLTEEAKSKLRGLKRSRETILKIIAAQEKTSVKCSNGLIFESLMSAKRWLIENNFPRASHSAISSCISGKRKEAYGFRWEKYEI